METITVDDQTAPALVTALRHNPLFCSLGGVQLRWAALRASLTMAVEKTEVARRLGISEGGA